MTYRAPFLALACAAALAASAVASSARPAFADAMDAAPTVVTTFAGGARAGDGDGGAAAAQLRSPTGIALARDGSLYVSDPVSNVIRTVSPDRTVKTVAGKPGAGGNRDGNAAEAAFLHPQGIAVGRDGAVYVADLGNFSVRKLVHGVVTTIAGGHTGSSDGKGAAAQFMAPRDVAVDRSNNVYVADSGVGVRKIAPDGTVTTLAPLGIKSVTGVSCAGELLWVASPAGLARYETSGANTLLTSVRGTQTMQTGPYDGVPYGVVAFNDTQAVYSDVQSQTVRYVEVDRPSRVIAGAAEWNSPQFGGGFADGKGGDARFYAPTGLALRPNGTLLVADAGNHRIRSVSPWDRRTYIGNDGAHLEQYAPAANEDGIAWISNSQAWFDTTFAQSIEGVAQAELAKSPMYSGTGRRPKIIPIAVNGAEIPAFTSIVNTYFADGFVKAVVWQLNCTFGIDARTVITTLRSLDGTLRPKHVAFIVVMQPTSLQDFPNESIAVAQNYGYTSPNFVAGPSSCYADFISAVKQSGVPYEDSYADFAAVENTTGGPLFSTIDQHLNARGRAILGHVGARALQKYLKRAR